MKQLNNKLRKTITVFSISILLIQLGCGNETFTPDIPLGEVSFTNDVSPIFENSCALPGCHVPNNAPRIDFTQLENIQDEGEEIIPWVTRRSMPPADAEPITTEEINLIVAWIEQGALNN